MSRRAIRSPSARATKPTDHAAAAESLAVQYVARDSVHPDPLQPRQAVDAELRDSIRALGILQPITVRRVDRTNADIVERAAPCNHCARPWREIAAAGEFVIVDGERRWLGAEGVLTTIPVIARADQGDTYERLRTQLVANTGKPLTPIEEARTYARMLETRDVGIAALARDIGRPASTVNDRVKLLQLGPWLPWIESGSVTTSMAVEHLVPLRGVPDEYHAKAVEEITTGCTLGEELADDVEDFGNTVRDAYKTFIYPLVKTKNDYEKQPEFSTKHHDDECSCGGIDWKEGWNGAGKGRCSCGNPDWWKPLHAAALKTKREKAKIADPSPATTKKGGLRLELPAGAPTVKMSYNDPKGIIVLTTSEGRWQVAASRWNVDDAFDPEDLAIDETKLVRLKEQYSSGGLDRVGTKDLAAVTAARAAWAKRFEPARAKAAEKLLAEFNKLTDIYGVAGAGVHTLLGQFEYSEAEFAEIADLLTIPVPKHIDRGSLRRRGQAQQEWFAKSIARGDAERLLSFVAFMSGSEKRQLPSKQLQAAKTAAVEEIGKKRAPWATTKTAKASTTSKSANSPKGPTAPTKKNATAATKSASSKKKAKNAGGGGRVARVVEAQLSWVS
jgi:hypothetical protein